MQREGKELRAEATVPRGQWDEALAGFSEEHKGQALSIRVVEVDGSTRSLADPSNLELRLLSLGAEERAGDQVVLLFAHKHPGAEIAQIEFSGAVGLTKSGASLSVHAEDGCHMDVRVDLAMPSLD